MDDSLDNTPDHRRRVAMLLSLLSSEEAQHALASRIEPEHLAYELARAWFDDVYAPSNRYLGGLKGDFAPEIAEQFKDCFDPVELAAMERFHRFFELRLEMIPERPTSERRIPVDERWRSIMKDAGYLLEDLRVDLGQLRRRVRSAPGVPEALAGIIRIEVQDRDTARRPPAAR